MIAGRQKVRDTALLRQAIDQRREADIPFFDILSTLNGVTDCRTKRTGYSVFCSCLICFSIESTSIE